MYFLNSRIRGSFVRSTTYKRRLRMAMEAKMQMSGPDARITCEATYLIKLAEERGIVMLPAKTDPSAPADATAVCRNGCIRMFADSQEEDACLKVMFVFGRPNGVLRDQLPTISLMIRPSDWSYQVSGNRPEAIRVIEKIQKTMGIGFKRDEPILDRCTGRAIVAGLMSRMKKRPDPRKGPRTTKAPKDKVRV
jgi:hypothetical protein